MWIHVCVAQHPGDLGPSLDATVRTMQQVSESMRDAPRIDKLVAGLPAHQEKIPRKQASTSRRPPRQSALLP